MMDAVPVIDFSAYSIDRESPDPEGFQKLIDDIHRALTTIGFMYLKNIGIPAQKIKDVFKNSRKFFSLSVDEKMQYLVPEEGFHGYSRMVREGLEPNRPYADLREYFDYCPATAKPEFFPEEKLPEFRTSLSDLFDVILLLHNRILEIMARGLKLEDPMYFVERHKMAGTRESNTALRTIFYPSLTNVEIKEGQIRCREHFDWGGITLLFQDSQPGLEVMNIHGQWIPASPIDGTIVVNIGEIMQMWTSDKLIASEHRVMVPADHIHEERQSIAFFGNPDNEAVIECIDKSNKYPTMTAIDHLNERFEMKHKAKTESLQRAQSPTPPSF